MPGERRLLLAEHEVDPDERPAATVPGLRAYQWLMQKDAGARHCNQRRPRALKAEHGAEVRIVCSHDPIEFELTAGRPLGEPLRAPAPVLTDPPPDDSVLF